ncbi:MAG: hypothetical protein FJW34_00960 [Acidobacteria bacterium]|nr:hypothetical protein [Acidobacteriota bacterium]
MSKSVVLMTRRCFSWSLCGLPLGMRLEAAETAAMPWDQPATVARVYLASKTVHWPRPDLDVAKDVAEVEARLKEVERRNAHNVRLVGGEVLYSDAEVKPWLARMADIDGVLIIPVSQPVGPLTALIDALETPALFFSRPYATHAWSTIAATRRNRKKKLDVVATTSYGDLDPYMRIFRTVRHLRKSKIIVGAEKSAGRQATMDAYTRHYGTAMTYLDYKDLKARFEAVDAARAQKLADEFVKGALRVVEPTKQEIHNALRFYLTATEIMKRDQANALTVDCFGTWPAKQMVAYPCITFSKLNDAGMYGVCEGDLPSTMTQILVTSYSGMPGFVTDPVFDLSRNEVIHAHCVAATKMGGLSGPSAPYAIRHHLETAEGAVLQVLMPSDQPVTVARFNGPAQMLVTTGEVTGTVDSDRGCRSQIRTRVKDAEKWLQNYGPGLHRVVFYGDHTRTLERMGRLLGFEVVYEM